MRRHGVYMWLCATIVVGAVVLAVITESPLAVLPAIGCVVMIVAMIFMMGETGD